MAIELIFCMLETPWVEEEEEMPIIQTTPRRTKRNPKAQEPTTRKLFREESVTGEISTPPYKKEKRMQMNTYRIIKPTLEMHPRNNHMELPLNTLPQALGNMGGILSEISPDIKPAKDHTEKDRETEKTP